MTLHLEPARLAGPDENGILVFSDARLLAVLVRLSDLHGEIAGQWFLEAGFGGLHPSRDGLFTDLAAAQEWIAQRVRGAGR